MALARALVNRPKVLLLDEPLGALDLKLRREMQIELKQMQREVGITFVFVTHDQEEALTMSDRIAVFRDGRIEQVATPVELYEQPATPFVAGFVGTSNLLEGDGRAAARRRARAGQHPAREDHAAAARRPAARGRRRRCVAAGRGRARSSTSARPRTPSSTSTPAARLTVLQQNLEHLVDPAPRPPGRAGHAVAGGARHVVSLGTHQTVHRGRDGPASPRRPHEEDARRSRRRSLLAAGLGPACGTSSGGGDAAAEQRRRRHVHRARRTR